MGNAALVTVYNAGIYPESMYTTTGTHSGNTVAQISRSNPDGVAVSAPLHQVHYYQH